MRRLTLVMVVVTAVLCACSKRPVSGDFAMPEMLGMQAVVGDYDVELCCELSSADGIVEAGAYLSDGDVETRNKGVVSGQTIIVKIGGVKAKTEYKYRFYVSNGRYESVSEQSVFVTTGMKEYVEFEDEIFKEYCIKNFDQDHDGEISFYEAECVKNIDCSKMAIRSLKGVERFTSLRELSCRQNQLSSLDVSQNVYLSGLVCYGNALKSLDLSKNTLLGYLDCNNNMLTSLDLSNNTLLTGVYCYGNLLKSIVVGSNPVLTVIGCGSNNISEIDISNCPSLNELSCYGNHLTNIDLSGNADISVLELGQNFLRSVDLSNNKKLSRLDVGGNYISSIDISMLEKLESISVEGDHDMRDLEISHPELIRSFSIGATKIRRWDYTDMPRLEEFAANDAPLGHLPVFYSNTNIRSIHLSGEVSAQYLVDPEYFTGFPNVVDINCSCMRLSNIDFSKNPKLENLWLGAADNLTELDLSVCQNLRSIAIDSDMRLETVYVHPDVKIEELQISANDCNAEIKHKH